MSNKSKWEALSMRDRAFLIREAVRNGITDIGSIRDTWEHRFDGNSSQPTEDPGVWDTIKGWFSEKESIEQKPTTEGYVDLNEIKRRQAWAESRFKDTAVSRAGATGRFQVMPNVQADYIKAGGRNGNLKDPSYNEEVRDWQMEQLAKRPWVNKEGSTDSVKVGKQLAAYNYGPTNVVNALNKAKAAGIDIYKSFDWVNEAYLPKETVDYVNWVLRNKPTGVHRNDTVYNLNKHKYSGSENVIQDALDLYNPWSAESMVAKASSPLVEEGVVDLDTAKKAVLENDAKAREQMAKAHRNAAIASGAAAAGTVLATGALTPAITHGLQVLGNPALAKTTVGALTAAAADASGVAYGLKDLYDLSKKWGNKEFDWEDIPRAALDMVGTFPSLRTAASGISKLKVPVKKKAAAKVIDDLSWGAEFIDDLAVESKQQYRPRQTKLSEGELAGLPKGERVVVTPEYTKLLEEFNSFARKYGYPEATAKTYDELVRESKKLMQRHNSFLRGVHITDELIDATPGMSTAERLKYAATQPKNPDNPYIWVTPGTSNAAHYTTGSSNSSKGTIHMVRPTMDFTGDPMTWFSKNDFPAVPTPKVRGDAETMLELAKKHGFSYATVSEMPVDLVEKLMATEQLEKVKKLNPTVYDVWNRGPQSNEVFLKAPAESIVAIPDFDRFNPSMLTRRYYYYDDLTPQDKL